jgi:PKD repeat protein
VFIVATSIGSDYSTAVSNKVQIRLVPPGVIIPSSSTPAANFVVAPSAPTANSSVQFDASTACATQPEGTVCPGTGRIVRYDWDFGDGGTATGLRVTHSFARQQSYAVTLTIVNDLGIAGSTTKNVDVGAGAVPAPAFIFSPTAPAPSDWVHFDAQTSKPGAGHSIVRYVWNWGDGTAFGDSSSPSADHQFSAGTWVVTLTVQDETGQTASVTGQVKVAVATP